MLDSALPEFTEAELRELTEQELAIERKLLDGNFCALESFHEFSAPGINPVLIADGHITKPLTKEQIQLPGLT